MKTKLHFLAVLITSTNFLFAQEIEPFVCGTIMDDPNVPLNFSPFNNSAYSGSVDPEYLASFEPISFNIFFWIINPEDENVSYIPVTYQHQHIKENMERINELFSPMNICFVLKGYDVFKSDSVYEDSTFGQIINQAATNGKILSNAFNVYIPKNLAKGNGVTYDGDNRLAIRRSYFIGNSWELSPGNVLAHELAHDFGLRHPWGSPGGSTTTPEHVTRDPNDPNYNALTQGDYVHDTPAMASFSDEAVLFGLTILDIIDINTCNYMGTLTDNLNVPFELTPADVGNIMGYTYQPCITGFTIGQGIRIREYIADPTNANRLSLSAKRENNTDLYIKDTPEDLGIEPNTISDKSWISKDIWVRNQNDGIEEHQNPEYHPTNPNYIYVRVSNRGCGTSVGDEKLSLFWAKASPSLSWDYSWNEENKFPNGKPVGGKITTIDIPPIAPNESIVVVVPWENIPNPSDYDDINQTMNEMYWHFCLLAQVEAENDPITDPNPTTQSAYVRNNNNVAQKNITIVDLEPNPSGKALISGVIAVGNVYDTPKCYSLEFVADGNEIVEEAEISIELDNNLQTIWEKGGKQEYNILSSRNTNKLIIKGDNAQLKNLCFGNRQDIGTLNLKFNFLTQKVTEKQSYTFHVIQKDENGEIIGGETYEIRKPPRPLFYANADNIQADKNEIVTLSATPINEPAIYNWYDVQGNLIREGMDFTTSITTAQKYKLEVIALSDGYKDYTEAKIGLKPNRIDLFYPNPTSDLVTINYKINQDETARLELVKIYPTTIGITPNNYILDVNDNTKTLNLRNYSAGLYKVILVVDGKISDTQTLLKN